MSRNDVILVVCDQRMVPRHKYYIVTRVNADTQWNARFAKRLIDKGSIRRFTKRRGFALELAHDLQKRIQSEYGVREIDIAPEDGR